VPRILRWNNSPAFNSKEAVAVVKGERGPGCRPTLGSYQRYVRPIRRGALATLLTYKARPRYQENQELTSASADIAGRFHNHVGAETRWCFRYNRSRRQRWAGQRHIAPYRACDCQKGARECGALSLRPFRMSWSTQRTITPSIMGTSRSVETRIDS